MPVLRPARGRFLFVYDPLSGQAALLSSLNTAPCHRRPAVPHRQITTVLKDFLINLPSSRTESGAPYAAAHHSAEGSARPVRPSSAASTAGGPGRPADLGQQQRDANCGMADRPPAAAPSDGGVARS